MAVSKKFHLITDQESLDELSEKELKHIEENIVDKVNYIAGNEIELNSKGPYLIYLKDEKIKELIPALKKAECLVAFLPHPESQELNTGFNLDTKIENALTYYLEYDESVTADLLYCNDKPVLNYVTSGDIMSFLTAKNKRSLWKGFKNLFRFFKRLKQIKAKLFIIQADDKEPFETAATDLLIVQHSKNATISRMLLENSFVNDGMFHTLIFAPRSLGQLMRAYFLKLFLGSAQKNHSFEFLGHIKTQQVKITFSQETDFVIDGQKQTGDTLTLSISPGLHIIPSESLVVSKKEADNKKIFQTNKLPRGEAKKDMTSKLLPWIKHASTEEYKELFTVLRSNARPKESYIVLMILSTILATFGLFANSSPVIIGAMILAPLMAPIISLSMGVLRQDKTLTKSSLITVLIGLAVGYLFAIILTIITPLSDLNAEISARTNPNIIDLGIAVISGVAGAYAYSKEEIAKTLAGVAIAVALVPPLAVSGIGIGWGNWSVFFGSFLLLLTNLTGMVLAGSLTFLFVGYSPFRLARKGLLISGFVVLALSIPLGYGFVQVVQENRIIKSINHTIIDQKEIKDVSVIKYKPLTLKINVVTEKRLNEEEIIFIKNDIEKTLNREVMLEINTSIKK